MINVVVDHHNHILAFGIGNFAEEIANHPGSRLRTFEVKPDGLRSGNYLNPAGVVERALDTHYHIDLDILWDDTVRWAQREQANVVRSLLLEPNDFNKRIAKVFGGFIYNVLLAASHEPNRHDTARWAKLEGSMLTWRDFAIHIDRGEATMLAPPLRQSGTIPVDLSQLTNSNMSSFYDENDVFLYINGGISKMRGRGIGGTIADYVPFAAPDANHYIVRDVLNYKQDSGIINGALRTLGFTDRNGLDITNLLSIFDGDTYSYEITTTADHLYLVGRATYKHLNVDPSDVIAEDGKRYNLSVGENTITVNTRSQDGSDERTYTITVTRTTA